MSSRLQLLLLGPLADAQNPFSEPPNANRNPELLLLRYHIAFLKDDQAGMDRDRLRARETRSGRLISHAEALVGSFRPVAAGQEEITPCSGSGSAGGSEGRAAMYELGVAVWRPFRNALAARQNATAALALSKGRDVEYGAAFALAFWGLFPLPNAANDLQRRFPEDTSVRFKYIANASRAFALENNDPRKAIELLQSSLPMSWPYRASTSLRSSGVSILPMCAARRTGHPPGRRGRQGIPEIPQSPRPVFSDPAGAVARLQLARATHSLEIRPRQKRLSGLSCPLARRGPWHPDAQTSQGGIRQTAVDSGSSSLKESKTHSHCPHRF